jgi:hypothetical protein
MDKHVRFGTMDIDELEEEYKEGVQTNDKLLNSICWPDLFYVWTYARHIFTIQQWEHIICILEKILE